MRHTFCTHLFPISYLYSPSRLFRENHPWDTYCQVGFMPNELCFSLGNKSPCRTFTLSFLMNLTDANKTQTSNHYEMDDYTLRTIEWAVLEAPPKTVHYFSNLPYGWIPRNDLEFVQLFMQTWREDWITFCQEGRRYLGQLVGVTWHDIYTRPSSTTSNSLQL